MTIWLRRLSFALRQNQGLVVVVLAALVVRLVWNLGVHRPADFALSDMGGYIKRADEVLVWKTRPAPYMTLFPWGTHGFVAVVKWIFGKHNKPAIGVAFALAGTIAVAYSYATAVRLFPRRRGLHKVLGLLLVFYYPWISLSGYVLSEPLFSAAVATTAFHGLRLADEGRTRDAWLFGIFAALGALVRPQILLSVAFIGAHALLKKRSWRRRSVGVAFGVAFPIVVALGVSVVRSEHELGHFALVSTNGPLNFAFGRCHATTIEAKARDGSGFFGPPPLGSLWSFEKKHPHALIRLSPATSEVIKFRGHMWDGDKLDEIARQCVARTGWLKQGYYALTHVILLYGFNTIWPDSGINPWRKLMTPWCHAELPLVVPALVFALVRAFSHRRPRELLVAMHLWALVATAILYFGDTRYRAPYDGLILALALPVYADLWRAARSAIGTLRARRSAAPGAIAPAAVPQAATLDGP